MTNNTGEQDKEVVECHRVSRIYRDVGVPVKALDGVDFHEGGEVGQAGMAGVQEPQLHHLA